MRIMAFTAVQFFRGLLVVFFPKSLFGGVMAGQAIIRCFLCQHEFKVGPVSLVAIETAFFSRWVRMIGGQQALDFRVAGETKAFTLLAQEFCVVGKMGIMTAAAASFLEGGMEDLLAFEFFF
jgi:hypothetical protein